jgi:cell division protein FtsX
MLNALKNLIVAMINATLILIVLALFLAWNVTNKADQIASNFARSIVTVQPLREDIQGMTAELAAIRGDIAQISGASEGVRSASLQRIAARLDQMEARAETARLSISELSQAPTKMVDYAINSAVDAVAQGAMDIRGCAAPNS